MPIPLRVPFSPAVPDCHLFRPGSLASPAARPSSAPFLSGSLLLPVLALSLSGCANPGPPRPPSLHLPSPVRDLRAERVGAEVRLAWTTPSETTDDLPVRGPLQAEICRDPSPPYPAPASSACTVVRRLGTAPGPVTASDVLPPDFARDPVRPLVYRVRILNAAGHAANPSNEALAAAGTAPPPVAGLRAELSPTGGARLLWQPDTAAATILLRRSISAAAVSSGAAPAPSRTAALRPSHKAEATMQLVAAAPGADRGAALDPNLVPGTTYTYLAWRLSSVTVDNHPLTLRSPDSAPVTLLFRDRVAPAAPAGLALAADGSAVDLSWEPATEPDLAGYWIERAPSPQDVSPQAAPPPPASWTRLNSSLLTAPAFQDHPPFSATRWSYRVLAVDVSGNLSQPSSPVFITARPPSAP